MNKSFILATICIGALLASLAGCAGNNTKAESEKMAKIGIADTTRLPVTLYEATKNSFDINIDNIRWVDSVIIAEGFNGDTASSKDLAKAFSLLSEVGYRSYWTNSADSLHFRFYVKTTPALSDTVKVTSLAPVPAGSQHYQIGLQFTKCDSLATLTEKNIMRSLAIAINGEIKCAPFVQSKILEGRLSVSTSKEDIGNLIGTTVSEDF